MPPDVVELNGFGDKIPVSVLVRVFLIRATDSSIFQTLGRFHPSGPEAFKEEVEKAFALLSRGDHFHYLFTDRDGTLKSYSCSYPASIQPAYSAVIQAQFARRCAQFCAIVTTSPLMHIGILNVSSMPEGYYAYGASAGREWYMNPAMQFKDDTINEEDLALLNNVVNKAPYEAVNKIVDEVDPTGSTLTLRESDYDLKIFTKAKLSGRIFNKGHGIRLIERKMGLKMNEGRILVCECLACSPKNVYTIWVTSNPQLQEKVRSSCTAYGNDNFVFVSCPEWPLVVLERFKLRSVISSLEGTE
uniref:Trehalose-6-phosphate phosphatase C-terminal domain-containing protein n=1 Tax=Parascaris equorum TaxID=6256 RepID=A0A914REZ2_PAREQ